MSTSNWIGLTCGIVELCASTITTIHISRGSKSHFAYVLMAFTFGFGVYQVIQFWNIKNNFNLYVNFCIKYLNYWCYLQSWFFGMKYLDSWIISIAKPKFNLNHSHYLKWGGAILYTLALLILMIVTITTYSQYGGY